MERWKAVVVFFCLLVGCPKTTLADYFSYLPPGKLIAGSGTGKADQTIHAPGIRFPVESGPVFANSQRWRPGGEYGSGTASDPLNFKYPWQDNFCETRGNAWATPECPDQNGGHHQGQDIRPPTNQKNIYWAVAVTRGQISYRANDYVVELKENDQISYRYLHLDPKQDIPGGSIDGLLPSGTTVTSGTRVGKISNWFGGGATTIHLHFDILRFMPTWGRVTWVSPYMSLVKSYENLIGYKGFTINGSVKVTGLGTGFLPVYGSTACGSAIGYRGETSVAVVLDGPVTCGGEIRWKVRFQDCLEGWVNSEWLRATGCSAALVNPKDGSSITFPAQFTGGWTGDCRNTQLAFYNGQQAVSFPADSFYDQTITESYWSQNVSPVIGNGPTYYWSIGENFCGAFFTRTAWQSFQKTTSCSAPMAFLARKGLIPRALAIQCGGNSSPTTTATRTRTSTTPIVSTPTRTGGVQSIISPTPTQVRTATFTRTRATTPTPTVTGTPTPTAGSLVFWDDFNRPDSAVAGNEWNNVHPSIFIQSNRLVGSGVVTRRMPFRFPLRAKAVLEEGGCGAEGGLVNHFDHQITIAGDQYGSGGYGLYFFKADQSISPSQILLVQGGYPIDRIYAPVDFAGMVEVDFSVLSDGSVRGAYRSQGVEAPFVFTARAIQLAGDYLSLRSYVSCPENHLAFDNLLIEAGAVPTNTPALTATASVTKTPIVTGTSTRTTAPTSTATRVAVVTPTLGSIFSFTATPLPTWTRVPTVQPTPTPTPTPSLTPGADCFQIRTTSGCSDEECEQKVCYHPTLGNSACCGGGSSPNGWTASCVASARYHCRSLLTPMTTRVAVITSTLTPTATPTPTVIP